MLEYIVLVTNSLPTAPGKISHNLTVPSMRHLHYLTLARFPILQYCCKLFLLAIKVMILFCYVIFFNIYKYIDKYMIDLSLGKFFFTWKYWGFGYRTCVGPHADRLAARS